LGTSDTTSPTTGSGDTGSAGSDIGSSPAE
jgi:hypothetical protein